jgi:hypothetical protein
MVVGVWYIDIKDYLLKSCMNSISDSFHVCEFSMFPVVATTVKLWVGDKRVC